MRRESSTVVVLVGEVAGELLAGLAQSPNVSVARAPAPGPAPGRAPAAGARSGTAPGTRAGTGPGASQSAANGPAAAAPGWEPGALALREAARRRSTYVIVPDDPLAEVAAAWREMWDVAAGSPGAAGFERHAAQALAAWRDKRFELPDYYLVLTPALGSEAGPDLYLGPLHAVRPRRVAVAGTTGDAPASSARLLETLRSLEHGPWWPPLDELLEAARHFYPGALAGA